MTFHSVCTSPLWIGFHPKAARCLYNPFVDDELISLINNGQCRRPMTSVVGRDKFSGWDGPGSAWEHGVRLSYSLFRSGVPRPWGLAPWSDKLTNRSEPGTTLNHETSGSYSTFAPSRVCSCGVRPCSSFVVVRPASPGFVGT